MRVLPKIPEKVHPKIQAKQRREQLKQLIRANLPDHLVIQEKVDYTEKERENFVIGIIGYNRTGKTTKELEIIEEWMRNNPDGEICSLDPQRKLTDITDRRLLLTDSKEEIFEKVTTLRNALVVLDDYKLIHPKFIPDPWVEHLFQNRGDWNIDIIYSIHNPGMVINIFTWFTDYYFIYFTLAQLGGWATKIPNYELCWNASYLVNKYVEVHGRGTYPAFPHIIVNCERGKLIAQNMEKDFI